MEKLSLEEIRQSNTKDLIEGLRSCKFSLLSSMGFRKMRAEMWLTGLICRLIVFLTGLHGAVKRAGPNSLKMNAKPKRKTARFLSAMTPVDLYGVFPHPHCGMVVGFNHPSLGEILRMIYVCVVEYRYQPNLFPVNLPWYEALMPIVHDLEALGIYIMPIITPSTREKMAKKADSNIMELVDILSKGFNYLCLQKCVDFIREGDNVWLAPSATRQASVFKTIEMFRGEEAIKPQTMTLLATALMLAKIEECVFLPIAVVPPLKNGRGLNLLRTYRIKAGELISMQTARENLRTRCEKNPGHKFEEMFLMEISKELIHIGGSHLICPDA